MSLDENYAVGEAVSVYLGNAVLTGLPKLSCATSLMICT
jgi:hypothetical protein